jgi:hypothetical protein
VGGALGGLASSAFIVGLILYIRRRRRHIGEGASAFIAPYNNPLIIGTLKVRAVPGGLSKSRPWAEDEHPRQSNDDMDRSQVRAVAHNDPLTQIDPGVREELAALRMQVLQLQDSRWGSNSIMGNDNDTRPPEYYSERGGGGE